MCISQQTSRFEHVVLMVSSWYEVLIGWQWKCQKGWVMVRAQMVGRIENFGGRYGSFLHHRKSDISPGELAGISFLQKQI